MGLMPGEVVMGESTGFLDGARYKADEAAMGAILAGHPFKSGPLLVSETVITTAAGKTEAAKASGCIAVDMESCGAARAASEAGVPFLAVRAVSDTVEEDLPVDFNRFMKGGGLKDIFLGGWNLAWIQAFQSGTPVNMTFAGSPNRYLPGSSRPNQILPNDRAKVQDWSIGPNRFPIVQRVD